MAIEHGMIGMITADSGRSPKRVAPFGGIEPKLGTNPICMAFPSNLEAPFYFDMATCAGAAGKLEVAEARVEPTGRHNDGCFIAIYNVEAFRPLETFKSEVTEFAQYLKATKPAAGVDEVLYPGEIEHKRRVEKLKNGIYVEDVTWDRLKGLADKYRVTDKCDFSE